MADDISNKPNLVRQPPRPLPLLLAQAMVQFGGVDQRSDLEGYLKGLATYLDDDVVPGRNSYDVVMRLGTSRLLDFGGSGCPVLLCPSLVNPYYILDLMSGRSLVQDMKDAGLRPFVIDWDHPGTEEQGFNLDNVILDRLLPYLSYVVAQAGGSVPLLGYCMGGTFSVAAARLRPEMVARLGLLATPWDFSKGFPEAHGAGCATIRDLMGQMSWTLSMLPDDKPVPVDWLQSVFIRLEPQAHGEKFLRFGQLEQTSDQAQFFIALETWVNDGPPLARSVADACIKEWYEENRPAKGQWDIGGQFIRAQDISCPALIVTPTRDRLVPPLSALALADGIPGCQVWTPEAGHVGMIVGSKAGDTFRRPLSRWLLGK